MRRRLHGSPRKSGARSVRRPKPTATEKFAEGSSRVKSCSCCRFLAVALDLNTRVLSSPQRTTIKRADFEIVGDTVRFATTARHGTITGNVKMVITDQSKLRPQQSPQPSPQKQP